MAISTVMKKLSMATVGSVLVAMAVGEVAQAASFNFSYTLESGDVLSGILEGDVQADGDTVFVSSITNSRFNGVLGPQLTLGTAIPSIEIFDDFASPIVSFSGLQMNIGAYLLNLDSFDDVIDGFSLFNSDIFNIGIYLGFSSYGQTFEFYDPQRWQLATTSVPEPASTLGLVALGAMGAGSMLKRKQQQKATVKA